MDIEIAKSDKELNEIYKFRFQIYINELGKHFIRNDKFNKQLTDEMDSSALQLYTENQGSIISTMRCNIKPITEEIKSKFDLNDNNDSSNYKYAQLDRFMIHKDFRGSKISSCYMDWLYRYGLEHNVVIALIKIEPKLLNYYKRYGFDKYETTTVNTTNENKRILCSLNLFDRENLRTSRSPFLRILDNVNHNPEIN